MSAALHQRYLRLVQGGYITPEGQPTAKGRAMIAAFEGTEPQFAESNRKDYPQSVAKGGLCTENGR